MSTIWTICPHHSFTCMPGALRIKVASLLSRPSLPLFSLFLSRKCDDAWSGSCWRLIKCFRTEPQFSMIEHEARLYEGWKSHVRNAWLSLKTPVQVWPKRQKLTCSYPLICHQQTLNQGKTLPITPCPWFKSLLSTGHPRARSVSLVPRLATPCWHSV